MQKLLLMLAILFPLMGCAIGNRFDPFSPKQRQELKNRDGKIEEVKNNTQGLMLEVGKLRQDSAVNAEKLNNYHSAFIYKGLAVGTWPCRETYLSLCVIHFQVGNILEAQKYFELGLSCNQSNSYEIMSNYWNPVWLDQLKTTINNQLKGI
jgi:hypothetical protein